MTAAGALAALREFARARPTSGWCDGCAAPLDPGHDHLLGPDGRTLQCACAVCARLLGEAPAARRRLVRRRAQRLVDFRLDDDTWRALGSPVGLAFFVAGAAGGVVARYPGPAGVVEADVAPAAWAALVAANPALGDLRPEVEALLVNRTGGRADALRVSIDACYRLAGILRRDWRGLGGGAEVHARIARVLADLDAAGDRA